MGASEDREPGANPPSEQEQREVVSTLLGFKDNVDAEDNAPKVGQKRPRDEKLTSKGRERLKKEKETRVRPPKQFKELFVPDKLREFRMPTVEAAARCEDIVMVWAAKNKDPAKNIHIQPHLFNYNHSVYLNDSELLEGLKGVQTAEEMEEFLRRFCGGAPMRKPISAQKRMKRVIEPRPASVSRPERDAGASSVDGDGRAQTSQRSGDSSPAAPEEDGEVAPAPLYANYVAKPLTVDTPWIQALPVYAKETIAKAAHTTHLDFREMLQLMKAIQYLTVDPPHELPLQPPDGSLFCIQASGPSLNDVDDGFKYTEKWGSGEKYEEDENFRIHYANTALTEFNVQRRVYHIGGCDRYVVHYGKQLAWKPYGEVQTKAPSLLKSVQEAAKSVEGAAAALEDAEKASNAAMKKDSENFAEEVDKPKERIPRSALTARLLSALGVRVLAPRVRLERCCDVVNAAFDDLGDTDPQLTAAALRQGAFSEFDVAFSSLTAAHEKKWHALVDEHPQRNVIHPLVADVAEPLVAEGKAAAVLEAAPTYDLMEIARALGVLANSRSGDNRALMDLVMYIQSGRAPVPWAANTFTLIRDAVCKGDMDKAQMWAEMAVESKPAEGSQSMQFGQ